ncbi:uncharacterized mitochondrial protein AtMg00810-like [Phaseolus vulgaris]|uniref:uncharacterized mitochondrial protein AtMg00810-like n=1 Tax=Phaseolus vulgaris TaxID=3885 RepID=UPI0035CAC1D4
MIEKTLFIKKSNSKIILVQIYIEDIIFGATKDSLCEEFVAAMQDSLCEEFVAAMQGEFEMSMMRELSFFLGLQVKQSKDGIFLSQSKYCKEIIKKFEMESCKEASKPMPSSCYMEKRFQANSKESHLKAAKRILKYLKGTTNGVSWIGKAQVALVIFLD